MAAWKCGRAIDKNPLKCAKKGFWGKCRKACDAHWAAAPFCTAEPEFEGKKKFAYLNPASGYVDWRSGAPCACTKYVDGATARDAEKGGLCQKMEHDGLGGKRFYCRKPHSALQQGVSAKERCGGWDFCTAHPSSPPPPPPPSGAGGTRGGRGPPGRTALGKACRA